MHSAASSRVAVQLSGAVAQASCWSTRDTDGVNLRGWRILRRCLWVAALVTWAVAVVRMSRAGGLDQDPWWVAYLIVWPLWALTHSMVRRGKRTESPGVDAADRTSRA
jgi:hypothetical protein